VNSYEHSDDVWDLVTGFCVSQCIHAAVVLRLADHLTASPLPADAMAKLAGTPLETLTRLLRVLTACGVVRRRPDGLYILTHRGERLREDAPDSLRAQILHLFHSSNWAAWGDLLHSIRTGGAAFAHALGENAWVYRETHPEAGRLFADMASAASRQSAEDIVSRLDLSRAREVVDLGGGNGALLAAVLRRWPKLNGTLLDLPSALKEAPSLLAEAGVSARCRILPGNFLEAVPSGGDVYVLKSVLHDWDDESASRILRNCRRVMRSNSELVLIESMLEEKIAPAQAFMDLHMLVIHGGRERTRDEISALCRNAGFEPREFQGAGRGATIAYAIPA